VREAGIDYEADIWWGLFAPRGLPEPILARVNAETNAALRDPAMARLFQAEGARPSPASPAEFTTLLGSEFDRWREVAQAANIRPEG
jgi:tripartite-type tricarboxylate transporter receptor subunit TctC